MKRVGPGVATWQQTPPLGSGRPRTALLLLLNQHAIADLKPAQRYSSGIRARFVNDCIQAPTRGSVLAWTYAIP